MIDRLNTLIGKSVSWLCLALVLLMVGDVFFRYLFNSSSAWSAELEWHLFSVIFLLAAGWTLHADRHVRVDVFYQNFSEKRKRWIDLLGCLFFLLPFCTIGFWESLGFVKSSFLMGETSADPGGLPFRFIIKGTIPIGFLLLGLQGISIISKNIAFLKNG